MQRKAYIAGALALALIGGFQPALALGGFGGSQPDTAGETVRKIKMMPLDEKNLKTYGWVRISADQLTLGANHVTPDQWYSVYFVNDSEKIGIGERPQIRSTGAGELKFSMRLTEPIGAKWAKIVIFQHDDHFSFRALGMNLQAGKLKQGLSGLGQATGHYMQDGTGNIHAGQPPENADGSKNCHGA